MAGVRVVGMAGVTVLGVPTKVLHKSSGRGGRARIRFEEVLRYNRIGSPTSTESAARWCQ